MGTVSNCLLDVGDVSVDAEGACASRCGLEVAELVARLPQPVVGRCNHRHEFTQVYWRLINGNLTYSGRMPTREWPWRNGTIGMEERCRRWCSPPSRSVEGALG